MFIAARMGWGKRRAHGLGKYTIVAYRVHHSLRDVSKKAKACSARTAPTCVRMGTLPHSSPRLSQAGAMLKPDGGLRCKQNGEGLRTRKVLINVAPDAGLMIVVVRILDVERHTRALLCSLGKQRCGIGVVWPRMRAVLFHGSGHMSKGTMQGSAEVCVHIQRKIMGLCCVPVARRGSRQVARRSRSCWPQPIRTPESNLNDSTQATRARTQRVCCARFYLARARGARLARTPPHSVPLPQTIRTK